MGPKLYLEGEVEAQRMEPQREHEPPYTWRHKSDLFSFLLFQLGGLTQLEEASPAQTASY